MAQERKKIVLWVDKVSQPARAVIGFCRLAQIDHELKELAMFKGEHLTEDFAKINPAKQIPVLQEIDEGSGETFTLSESHAILRYLADSRGVADHWYPRNLRKRAKVDQYLDSHHGALRYAVHSYNVKKHLSPVLLGKTYSEAELDVYLKLLKRSLKLMEF